MPRTDPFLDGSSNKLVLRALKSGRSFLLEDEANALCTAYGIPVPRHIVASSPEEAARAAEEIGYPVVMKIMSPKIMHKSDYGGVVTGVETNERAAGAYQRIMRNVQERGIDTSDARILVEGMAGKGVELIIGASRDPQFGPVVTFGLGGVLVDLIKDVSLRVCPFTDSTCREMISETKAYRLLEGYRGSQKCDIDALVQCILSVQKLMLENDAIGEVDLNPIISYPVGALAVDARIVLSSPPPGKSGGRVQ